MPGTLKSKPNMNKFIIKLRGKQNRLLNKVSILLFAIVNIFVFSDFFVLVSYFLAPLLPNSFYYF